MSLDQSIVRHYHHGTLEQAILAALAASGKDLTKLTHAELAAVDEFHIGGRRATMDLGAQIELPRGAHVLDIGSGLGGASRYFAVARGWKVDGIDLTAEYVEVASSLSKRVGLGEAATYRRASATSLPFAEGTFDGAYMLHVGMNIADKKAAFAEIHRVLKAGGIFAIYDVMRESDGEFSYPLPWSAGADTNFIDTGASYRRLLGEAGFTVEAERSRRDFAIELFQRMRQGMAAKSGGPPSPGLQIVMGASAPQKVANMVGMLERGIFAPTEMIARAS